MKNGYPPHCFLTVILLVIGTYSFAQKNTNYQLSYETIEVDPVQANRYLFDMAESEKIVTLTGLKPGDHYELLLVPFDEDNECFYQIDDVSENGNVQPFDIAEIQQNNYNSITFQATSTTVTLHVSDNGCKNGKADRAALSLLNHSCITSPSGNDPDDISDLNKMMAVLQVDANYSVEQLISEVFIGGGCFDITNVQLIGNIAGVGHFSAGSASIGLEDGVILASGNITNAPGPNNSGSAGNNLPGPNGDPDLALLGAGTIFDASGIEFDFTPTVPVINFNYAFGSEEYCEFVGSTFNDVFGFFISGPGIAGPFTNGAENIALVPGSGAYVAINSVNHNMNTAYFNGNDNNCNGVITNPNDIQYDGYTTVLTATANVIPCETYHIRLVVSDVGDQIYDSGVFLGANSFDAGGGVAGSVVIPGVEVGEFAYEGCSDGFIIFEKENDAEFDVDVTVEFEFDPASTATNGVDYSSITSPIIIPAGQTSISIPFNVFQDNIVEGVESVIILLDNACSCTGASIEILINDVEPLVSVAEDLVFCNEANVTIGPDVSGGVPDYTYIWNTGSTNPTIDINQNFDQTFYVTISDDCNQSVEDTIAIIVQPGPTAEISGTAILCGGNPTGFFDITFGGVGPWEFFYFINGTIYGPIVTALNPYQLPVTEIGTYSLQSVYTVDGGCEGTVGGTATVEESAIDLQEIPSDLTCANAFDGVITVTATGGEAPYSYEWNTGDVTETITNLPAGTYTVTVTDVSGCTQEITSTIIEPPVIELSATPTAEVDCNNPNGGEIDLNVSGGSPGYTFIWDNNETTEDLTGVPAGTYTVTVTDLNGCTEETVAVISENIAEPTANATGAVISCTETEVTISGSGNGANGGSVSYQWLDGNGTPISNSGDVNVDMVGTYTFIVTDDTNGCTAEVTVDVSESADLPTPDATTNGIITCANGMVTIDGSGSSGSGTLTYLWLDGNGNPVGSGQTIDVMNPGNYTLVITDTGNGCTNEINVDVPENTALPTPQIDPPAVLDCNITTTTITGSGSSANGGPTTLEWFDGGGNSLGGGNSVNVTGPGSYTLIVTDDDNGCTNEATVNVSQDLTPPPVDAQASVIDCNNAVAILTGGGGGGDSFEWIGPGGNVIGNTSPIDVTVPGTYTLVVTSATNGCTGEMMVDVVEDIQLPTVSADASGPLTCVATQVTLTGSGSGGGNLLYGWYDANGNLISNNTTTTVMDEGTYTFIVTNATNGCSAEMPVTVTSVYDLPIAAAVPNGIITCTQLLVNLDGSGSSGNGPLTYEWFGSGGAPIGNGSNVTVNQPGTYVLIVTNGSSGCTDEVDVVVTADNIPPSALIFTPGLLDCTVTMVTLNGSGSFNNGGGVPDLEWFGPAGNSLGNSQVIDVMTPGTYTLVATDAGNGCTSNATVVVQQNIIPPPVNADVSGVITCAETFVVISTTAGNNGNDIEWFNPSGGSIGSASDIIVTETGTYTIIVTGSGNGCTSEMTLDVTDNVALPTADAGPNATITCAADFATLTGSGSSTNGNTLLEWYNAGGVLMGTGESLEVTQSGTYTLIVTDPDNGCTAESFVTVTPDADIPSADVIPPLDLTCLNEMSTLYGSTTATGNIQIGWFNEAGNLITSDNQIDVNVGGVYTFVVTNLDNDCTAESSVLVTDLIDIPVAVAEPLGELSCEETSVILDGSFSSPFGSLTYEWIDPNGGFVGDDPVINATEPGTYILNITNIENGCTATVEATITTSVALPQAVAVPDGIVDCNSNVVLLDGSGSSGGGTLSYVWFNGPTQIGTGVTQQVNGAGTYTLFVTDLTNGCSAETTVTVDENLELPIPIIEAPALLDCTAGTVTLDGSGSSGNGLLGYEWFGPNGAPIGTGNTVDVTAPGNYTLIVTNGSSGCTAEVQTTVGINEELPDVTATVDGPLTCTDLMVNLTGSGSSSNGGTLSYEWFDAGGTSIGTGTGVAVGNPGTYTFMVTNTDNGCTAEMPVTVSENVLLPTANAGPIGLLTCDVTMATLDGTGSSSGTNFTYQWTNGGGVVVGTTPTIQVGQTGTYTLIVTNGDNGCTALATTTVEPDADLPVANAGAGATLNCNILSALLDGSGSSSGPGITYEWFDPSGAPLGSGLSVEVFNPGTYTFIVSNTNNGCTAASSVGVTIDNALPVADPGTSPLLDCDASVVTLDGSGSTGATSYVWTDAAGNIISNNTTVDVEIAGTYQLLVTAANGCTAQANITVGQDNNVPVADPGLAGNLDCTTTQVIIGGNNTSQGPGITYEWTDASGAVVATTATYTATNPGNYTLTVFNNNNNCESSASVTVDQDEGLPSADAGAPAIIDCTIFEVTLDGSGSSSGGNISYQWFDQNGTPIGTGVTVDVEDPGTYTLLVSDNSNGCVAESQVVVTDNLALPNADAGPGQLLTCDVDMVSLDGSLSTVPSGGITYEWINAGGVTVGTTAMIDVTQAGTYQLLITGDNGCTDMASVTVLLDADVPVADAGPGGDINCLVDMVTLGGSQTSTGTSISYEWVDANGTVVATTPTFETTDAGIYTLTVFDTSNDCVSTSSAAVDVLLDIPTVDPGPGGTLTCDLAQIMLGGNGTTSGPNITYTWTDANGTPVGSNDELMVTAPGTYTLTVENGTNGCSNFASVTVDENELLPNADAGPDGLLTCVATAYTLDGTGSSTGADISYNWYNAAGNLISQSPTYDVTVAGEYTLVVNDASNGCSSSATVVVAPDANAPVAVAAPVADLTCTITSVILDGSASITNSGALDYEWMDASGAIISSAEMVTVTEPGTYTLIVTDVQNFCDNSITVEVGENLSSPVSDAGNEATITCDVSQVSLTGAGSNGTNLTYQWLNPNGVSIGNTETVLVSTVGTYTFVVTDNATGCTATSTTAVTPDANLPVADAGPNATLNCNITQVSLTGSGNANSGDMTMEWFGPTGLPISNLADIDVTAPGIYTLIITDNVNSCTAESLVEVLLDNALPVVNQGPDQLLDCEVETVTLTTTNNTAVSYEWTDEDGNVIGNGQTIDVTIPGQYQIEVVGANGCSNNAIVTVGQDANVPTADSGPNATLDCITSMYTIGGTQTTTGPGITYEWLDANNQVVGTAATLDITTPGTYTLTVINTNNDCQATDQVVIDSNTDFPNADPGVGGILTCALTEISIGGANTSSGNEFTIIWQNANGDIVGTNPEIEVTTAGVYTMLVTNTANGCTATSSVEVTDNLLTPSADAGPTQELTCDISMVMIDGSNSTSPSGNLQYQWTNAGGVVVGTTPTIDVDEQGVYNLLVTADNGCTSTAQVAVTIDANVPNADAGPGGALDCNTSVISIGGTQTSSGAGITYEWLNANDEVVGTTPTLDVTDAGVYTLVVYNSNNDCDASSSVVVSENVALPEVDPGAGGMLTCALTEIMLGGGNTTTGSNINYTWQNANGDIVGTDLELSVNTPGTYTLTVNNTANNCSDFASVTVDQNNTDPFADAGPSETLTCEITNVLLTGSNSSTGPNIVYTWYDDQGVQISNAMNVNVSTSGLYTLEVLDTNNGCQSTAQVEVVPDENLPNAVAATPDVLTCTIEEVWLSGLGSSSVSGDLTYEWQDASNATISNTEDVMVNAPGIYTLIIVDPNNGCTDAINVEVPQNIASPTADAGNMETLTCAVSSVMLTGSGTGNNLTYEWFNQNNVSIGNTLSVNVASAGTYTLVVTDGSNGCEASSSVQVVPDGNLPAANANVGALLNCVVDVVQISGAGSSTGTDITYEWLNPQGQNVGTAQDLEATAPGLYTLVVYDQSNGCSAQTTVLVEENEDPPSPNINALGSSSIDCNNALVILDAGSSTPLGILQFQWSTTNGNIIGSTTSSQIEANAAGVYSLLVINTLNGCVENTDFEVTIDQAEPTVNVAAPPVLTCVLTQFQLNGNGTSTNGNFTYNWTGNISSGQGTLSPTINSPGTYTLTVINEDNGCVSDATITVTENTTEPDAAAATGDDLDCITEEVNLNGSGSSQGAGFNYQWSGPGILSGATGLNPVVNAPGSYQLLVTNTINGCTEIATTDVFENGEAPTAAAILPEPPLCVGEAGSLAVVSITGGTPPYTYSVDNGNSFYPDSSFTLEPGNYDVLIQDATGCEFQQSIYIPDALPVEVQLADVQVEIQLGAGTQLQAVTNVPTWAIDTIMWTPTDSLSCTNCLNPWANPTESTTYEVTVVNQNGCEDKAEIRLLLDKDRNVYIPNAFSPNDDGDNDLFMIFSSEVGIKQVNHFQIYSRWGEMVYQAENFQPNDPAYGWGGWFRGELMNPAVFVYWAEVEFVDGYKGFYKGDVTLLK